MRLNVSERGRKLAFGGALLAAMAAVSCGGGEQETTFFAGRVLVFGDETSLLVDTQGNANALKYSVNATVSDTDPAIACAQNPLWVQILVNRYNLVFPECNTGTTPVVNPSSRIRATLGARAADLSAQIDAQVAQSAFQAGDLATVLVGVNDVLAQYAQYPAVGEIELTANVEAAGAETGRQVNRLADAGAKVLISTIPDVGYSPYAVAEQAAHSDTDRAALIRRLVSRFNATLRASITNDGRRIGLVLMDEAVQVSARFPGVNGFLNTVTGVCDLAKSALTPPSILDCTRLTLIADAGPPATYLWADDRHLSAGGQNLLGNLAVQRAENNPF